jgi:hypothetical protein
MSSPNNRISNGFTGNGEDSPENFAGYGSMVVNQQGLIAYQTYKINVIFQIPLLKIIIVKQ